MCNCFLGASMRCDGATFGTCPAGFLSLRCLLVTAGECKEGLSSRRSCAKAHLSCSGPSLLPCGRTRRTRCFTKGACGFAGLPASSDWPGTGTLSTNACNGRRRRRPLRSYVCFMGLATTVAFAARTEHRCWRSRIAGLKAARALTLLWVMIMRMLSKFTMMALARTNSDSG